MPPGCPPAAPAVALQHVLECLGFTSMARLALSISLLTVLLPLLLLPLCLLLQSQLHHHGSRHLAGLCPAGPAGVTHHHRVSHWTLLAK